MFFVAASSFFLQRTETERFPPSVCLQGEEPEDTFWSRFDFVSFVGGVTMNA